jgi:tetratricopeptide (TPR) repeat protein
MAESAKAHAEMPVAESKGTDQALVELLAEADRSEEAGDREKAIRLFFKATELHPHSVTPWMKLAVLYLSEDRTEDAIRAVGEVIKLRPKSPWGYAIQGLAHAVDREIDLAETAFESALRADPDYGLAISELAEIKEAKGQRKEAIELFERASRLDALTDSARAGYARVLRDEDRATDAEELLRAGVDEDDDQIESRRALVELLSQTERQQEGIDLLRRVAERSQDWRHWADLGSFVLSREGGDDQAVEALAKSIALGAAAPEVFVTYAQALRQSGEPESRILEVARDLTDRLSDDHDAWMYASMLAKAAGDMSLAETYVRKALDIVEDTRGWLALAILLQSQPKRDSETEDAFRKAVALAQGLESCSSVRSLAEFLVHRGEEAVAQDAMAKWFAGEKPCYCCAVLEGDIAARSGNADRASRAYRSALEERNDGVHALTGLSRFVDRDEGEELIARAMASDPTDHRCLLARAHLRQDDLESQIRDASEAIRLSPSYAESHLFLVRALLKHDQADQALHHLKLALKELPQQRELTAMFVDAAMAAAAAGHGDRVSEMLNQNEFGSNMEPLVVALRIRSGDKPVVAKEVLEVAMDIAASAPASKNIPRKSSQTG